MNFAKNNFRDWKTIREIRENFCPRTFLAIRYLWAQMLLVLLVEWLEQLQVPTVPSACSSNL